MTESEWFDATTDITPMLEYLRGRVSDRKVRLFAVACCYEVWKWMPDSRTKEGVRVAERFADGVVGKEQRDKAREGTAGAWTTVWGWGWHIYQSARAAHFALDDREEILVAAAQEVRNAGWNFVKDLLHCENDSDPARAALSEGGLRQAGLLRDIIGNPFHPVSFDTAWRTPEAVALAAAMYDSRDFTDMPRLGALLEAAGCEDDAVLEHCRWPGGHVKGCWVVDELLDRQ